MAAGNSTSTTKNDKAPEVAVDEAPEGFKPVDLYKGDETYRATSPAELVDRKWNGWSTTKPKK